MTDPKPKPERDDDSMSSERSAAILSNAQDIRPLEEYNSAPAGHIARNDPLANPDGHKEVSAEQAEAITRLAQDVRPLENP